MSSSVLRNVVPVAFFSLTICALGLAANDRDQPAKLTAPEIVAKNAEARGGLKAWRSVQTIAMSGKLDAGGTSNAQLPLVMEMKRPRKSRVELQFRGQTAVQVYDGTNGWKLRPYLNRKDVEPYSAEEAKAAAMQADLDGPLMDYQSKGLQVDLEGIDPVEGHPAYKMKVTQKDGRSRHVWVDTETFLDVKTEGTPRRLDGKYRMVSIYQRDFRTVEGLRVPYVIETAVDGAAKTEKIQLDNVTINPALPDSHFLKP